MKFYSFLVSALILATALSANDSGRVSVLCYHAFIDHRNRYCISCNELRSHIRFLKKNGCRFISFDDFRKGNYSGSKNVLVTVDDGNRSVYTAYNDVFRPEGIKPLLAIYPSVIGRKKYALTWEQLKELSGNGCEIASHGYQHLKMNENLFEKNNKLFRRELHLSKKILEKKLHKKVDVFVYPYGLKCRKSYSLMKQAGYRFAFTVRPDSICLKMNESASLELPRYMMTKYNADIYCSRVLIDSSHRVKRSVSEAVSSADIKKIRQRVLAVAAEEEPEPENLRPFITFISEMPPGDDGFVKELVSGSGKKLLNSASCVEKNNPRVLFAESSFCKLKRHQLSLERDRGNSRAGQVRYMPGSARYECRELFRGSAELYGSYLNKCRANFFRLEKSIRNIFGIAQSL